MTTPVKRIPSPIPESYIEEDEAALYARILGVQLITFKVLAEGRVASGERAILKGCEAEKRLQNLPAATKIEKREFSEAVKCVKSRYIGEFKGNKKPKLLFVAGAEDPNGACSLKHPVNCKRLKALNEAYDLKFVVAQRVDDIYKELKALPPDSLSGMVVDTHGDGGMSLHIACQDKYWDGKITDLKAADCFKDKAFIHLLACQAAAHLEDSPLYKMRDSLIPLGKKIILSGPATLIHNHDSNIQNTYPLKFEYTLDKDKCSLYSHLGAYIPCYKFPEAKNKELLNVTVEISTKP